MATIKISNPKLRELLTNLRKLSNEEKVNIWKRVAEDLERPNRNRRSVNLSKIDRYTKENDTVLVPGKVLATGKVSHKMTVCAYQFSTEAKVKLKNDNIEYLSIEEMIKKNPKGKNLRIFG